jgi:hypothetical protein
MTDDANCGCCGNACGPMSTCNNGKCGPAPVQLVPPSPGCGGIDLAVRDGVLAWTDRGHALVKTMPAAGGTATIIDAAAKPTTGIAIAPDGTVFWVEIGGLRRSQPNGPPSWVAMNGIDPIKGFALSPDGSTVYYSQGTLVLRMTSQGSFPLMVALEEHGGLPQALAVDGYRLMYPTELNGDVDVVYLPPSGAVSLARCGKDGPNGELLNVDCLRVARSQGSLLFDKIVALPDRVLWADGPNLKTALTVMGPPVTNDSVGYTLSERITGFAANPMVAYFSEASTGGDANGVIHRAVIGGNGTSVRIARGQREPRVGAIDQNRVYWSTGDCAIMATGL